MNLLALKLAEQKNKLEQIKTDKDALHLAALLTEKKETYELRRRFKESE